MRRLASLVLASFVGALLPVAAPPAAVAFALPSEFAFEAPPDGPLSRVGTYGYGTAGRFAQDPERPERDGLSATTDTFWWQITLEGPDGAALTPGSYPDARNLDNAAPGKAVFHAIPQVGFRCADQRTDLVVRDVARDGAGWLTRLDLSFELSCAGLPQTVRGEIRIDATTNPVAMVTQSPPWFIDPWDAPWGEVPVGETGQGWAFTATGAGTRPATISGVTFEGSNPDDFVIGADTCTGQTLDTGETCTFTVAFRPTAGGMRAAELVIASDSDTGARRTRLEAHATFRTTTTIELLDNPSFSPAMPRAKVTVTPNPGSGQVGVRVGTWPTWTFVGVPIGADGTAVVAFQPPAAETPVAGYYWGNGIHLQSASDPVTQVQGTSSIIDFTSTLNPQEVTKDVKVQATVSAYGLASPLTQGTLSITDLTTSNVLASIDLANGNAVSFTGPLALGPHDLVAEYTGQTSPFLAGPAAVHLSQVVIADLKVDATAFALSLAKFYPVVDGYRDTVSARGTLGEAASVAIKVVSIATGKTVRSASLGTRPVGTFGWVWNGRNNAGNLVAEGGYRVVQTVTDGTGNVVTSTLGVTLSKRTVTWKTTTLSKLAAKYTSYGIDTGVVSKARSRFSGGVYLAAGGGWAATAYAFSLPGALQYKTVKFKVRGRSRNGLKAWIGIWNPSLGSSLDLGAYDTWKRAGTAYDTYATSGAGSSHVKSGVARGTLLVEVEPAGAPIFDAAKVYLTVTYAVWS
ncbi:MAG: hypothetical protein A2V85_17310 [Chloroflexi bacterium RBG_16_72_14]|nr:MAG: hypothetical protein A2V85_17310 [Chloroflexi bacterium RBG_16_72_14]